MSRRPDPEEAAKLQYELEHTNPRNKSVVPYMALLIGVAFLLLVMAWLMQERTEASVQDLNQSVNSFQTIDQLVVENRTLRERLDALESERDAVRQQLDDLTATADAAAQEPQRHFAALSQLNQLRALYNQGKIKDGRAFLAAHPSLEEDLRQVAAQLSDEELAIYDPLAAYQKLVSLLG